MVGVKLEYTERGLTCFDCYRWPSLKIVRFHDRRLVEVADCLNRKYESILVKRGG